MKNRKIKTYPQDFINYMNKAGMSPDTVNYFKLHK